MKIMVYEFARAFMGKLRTNNRLRQAGNNSQIGSLSALIPSSPSNFLVKSIGSVFVACLFLINFGLVYAGNHAAGDTPSAGRTYFTTQGCSAVGCHDDPPIYPDLPAIANLPATLIALANANPSMTAGNRTLANAGKEVLSAYFASTLAPGIDDPPNVTLNPGQAYSYTITAPSTADFLVSTTTYSVSSGAFPTGISITDNLGVDGTISGNAPAAFTTPQTFTIGIRATNTDAGTSATLNGTPQTYTITVRAVQNIVFGTAPTVTVGGTGTVTATGGGSGNAVTFTRDAADAAICSINATTGLVDGLSSGTCRIYANQAANLPANYVAAAQQQLNLAIGAGAQVINYTPPPPASIGFGNSITITATGGAASGVPVTLALDGGSTGCSLTGVSAVANVTSATVTGTQAGTNNCIINANQAASPPNYAAATTAQVTISVGQATQAIVFGTAPTIVEGGTGTVVITSSGASGNPVTFTSLTGGVCSVTGSTVTALAVGTCTIAANQLGNTNYSAAPQVTQNIAIGSAPVSAGTATIEVPLNTPTTLNLAPFITGSAVTGVLIKTQPSGGTVITNGTSVTYVPKTDFFGKDSFTYAAFGATGESAPASVTVKIIGQPDPRQNVNVRNQMSSQMQATVRFNAVQGQIMRQRMEFGHGRLNSNNTESVTDTAQREVPARTTLGMVEARAAGLRAQDNLATQQAADIADSKLTATPSQNVKQNSATSKTAPILAFDDAVASGLDSNQLPYSQKEAALANLLNGPVGNGLVAALKDKTINLAALSQAVESFNDKRDPDGIEFWVAGNLRFGSRDEDGFNFTNFKTDGVTIGADKRFGENLLLGLGVGYAYDHSELASDGSNSTAKGYSVSLYGTYKPIENTFIDAMFGYGKIDFESERFVSSIGQFAESDRDGDQWFASVSGTYEFRNQGYLFAPYARLDLAHNRLDSTTEKGAGSNNLRFDSQTSNSAMVSAGFRAEATHQANFGVIIPRLRLEYQASTQSGSDTNIQYADQLGTNYRLAGTTDRQGSLVFGLGSDVLLKNGVRLALDYQSLRSPGTETSQAFSFRLSKDFGVNNNQTPMLSVDEIALPKLGIRLDMGYTYDDNVNRARDHQDIEIDRISSVNISKGFNLPVSEHTRIVFNAFGGAERSYRFRGLDKVIGGAQAELQYRADGGFSTPTFGVFGKVYTEQFTSELRDGIRISTGVNVRKPFTEKITGFAAFSFNKRNADSEVFDTEEVALRGNVDYLTFGDNTVYFTGEYRHGDIVSTASPSLENLDGSDAFAVDDVFKRQGYANYRFRGDTVLTTVGYNMPLGPTDSLDFSWRWVRSTPEDVPSYVRNKESYYDNQYSIVYLVRF